MDISLETSSDSKIINLSVDVLAGGPLPLKYRLKQSWDVLRGKEICTGDFIVRQGDIDGIMEILNRAKECIKNK